MSVHKSLSNPIKTKVSVVNVKFIPKWEKERGEVPGRLQEARAFEQN